MEDLAKILQQVEDFILQEPWWKLVLLVLAALAMSLTAEFIGAVI